MQAEQQPAGTPRLVKWITWVQGNPNQVLVAITCATLFFAGVAATQLGINSNNLDLISPDVPSRINQAEFSTVFPDKEEALMVVVESSSAALTQQAVSDLVERLNREGKFVEDAHSPGTGDFFNRHGLLYLDDDLFDATTRQLAQWRPFLISLESNPHAAGLFDLVAKTMRVSRFSFDYEETWSPVLSAFTEAGEQTLNADPIAKAPLLLATAEGSAGDKRVLLVTPKLQFSSIFAAKPAVDEIRAHISALGLDQDPDLRVRITGNPALNLEEMQGIIWDVGLSGIACFVLVVVIIAFALRSKVLVLAAVATLLVGLVWTAGLAALLVGHLNLVSVAVAILFIGLGVDFTIHLGVRYADALQRGLDKYKAMQDSITQIGGSLLICTCSTSIAFFVFVPTSYLGVAELGLIAGVGMLVIFLLTVTLFPALLVSVLDVDRHPKITHTLKFSPAYGATLRKNFRPVLMIFCVGLCIAVILVPKAQFDPNVIEMRDPSTESVQAFNDLLNESGRASPWHADVLSNSLDEADQLAARARALPPVSEAITLSDLVPGGQSERLEVLANLQENYTPIRTGTDKNELSLPDFLSALERFQDHLLKDSKKSDDKAFVEQQLHLVDTLKRLARQAKSENNTRAFDELMQRLMGDIDSSMRTLRTGLSAQKIKLENLPSKLKRRVLSEDGRASVQIFPAHDLRDSAALHEFVDSVKALAPNATGMAVGLVTFEEATKQSFYQALLCAFVLITVLLILIWRNLLDVLLVLCPLLLSLVLTVACMAVLDIRFNFTNVIVIPLMLGIGVDSGIHLVHRFHSNRANNLNLLNTTTARAVYYSALTTLISFGSLAFSAHQGMASLGALLFIGMSFTVLCNLAFLPALLEWRNRRWRLN